jgi:ribonuclease P/MRP protein subunit RPP20
MGYREVWIHGLGAAVQRALNLALALRRESRGALAADMRTDTLEVTDDLIPLLADDADEGRTISRFCSTVHIRLFRPEIPVAHY